MQNLWQTEFPKSTNPLSFFVYASRPHRAAAILAMMALIVASIMSTAYPYTFKWLVDAIVALPNGGTYSAVLYAGLAYVVLSTARELVWRGSGYAGSYWAMGARATARDALAAYVTLHSRDYFSNRFAGSLANKISHASSGVRELVDLGLWQLLEFIVSVLGTIVVMFLVSPVFGLLFIGWTIVILPFNIYRARSRIVFSIRAQEVETRLTGATVDLLSNASAMQEFARRPFELARLRDITGERYRWGLSAWHFGEDTLTINGFIQALFAAAMIFYAVYLAGQGNFTAGDCVLIVTLVYRMEDKFLFLGSHINKLSETWGEIEESLTEILEPHEIIDMPAAHPLIVHDGALAFDSVSFTYNGTDASVLSDFSLSIPAHQKVGLVGRSGAGKSTLVKLLLRHYEVTRGVISLDGQNIAKATLDSLRAAVAVVPQEPLLFHRSLRENIAYGNPDSSEEEIVNAAKMAYAHDFIVKLPKGYDTLVGERGVKLSGGERQRVAIARAILKDAPVLILDEATASLDSESEALIQKALGELMKGKTVIAIAHRLSTLREMDRIIVLESGRIAEEGTHAELLGKNGIYAGLWNHQAGGFLQDE